MLGLPQCIFNKGVMVVVSGSQGDETEQVVPQGGPHVDSQATVPATSPQIKASLDLAKKHDEEKGLTAAAQQDAETLTETGQQKKLADPGVARHRAPKQTCKAKGPKVKKQTTKTACKSKPKPMKESGKPGSDPNPFDLPPDPNQKTLDEFKKDSQQLLPPPTVPAPKSSEPPPDSGKHTPEDGDSKTTPHASQLRKQTTMDDVQAMLNRANTLEPAPAEPSPAAPAPAEPADTSPPATSLSDMGSMLEQEIKKKDTRKPKTQEEKDRHARRMRFFRSLTSLALSLWNLESS